jgi:hypothetical protein
MQSDKKIEKNGPIFGNLAKTVAKISKINLKTQNIYIQLLLNVKKGTKNHFFAALWCKNVAKSCQMTKFRPIWSHCSYGGAKWENRGI